MLDIKFIRENPDKVRENIKKKSQDTKKVDELLKKDKRYRELLQEAEQLRAKRNTITSEINQAKKQGKDISKLIKEAKDLPEKIKSAEEEQYKLKDEVNALLTQIPNIMHKSVPSGKDASENKVIKVAGKPKKFSFPIKNHVELIENLKIADFEASAKISGNGFYFIEGELALLNQALIRFTVDFMHKKGYRYIETPLMIKKYVLEAAMDVKAFEDSIYKVEGDGLCLIGTSEHSLLGRYAEKSFNEDELPKKVFSYSMCFRKEIGSHGINEKGLWRTHQFNKVEQFIFCNPEDSYKYYDELLKNSEEIMKALELPYRVIECCSGDLSDWKAKSCDIEVWRPTLNCYGEVMSLSNCTDYQARDLNMKVIRKDGTKEAIHTLNNTAMATSRIMVAILENYQNKDGSITIPKVLVKHMNGIKAIKPKK